MGIFSEWYTKEGPGVSKNAPQKKGVARFFEISFRDSGMIWGLNALTFLCFVPLILSTVFIFVFAPYLILILAGTILYLLSSCLVGPALCGLNAVIVSRIRDIPCFMMHEYKKAWKSNLKQSVPAGVLVSALMGIEIFTAYNLLNTQSEYVFVMLGIILLSIVLIISTFHLTFLQILFIDLPLTKMMKNGLLMSIGYLTRTIPAALVILVLYGAMAMFWFIWPVYIITGLVGFISVIVNMITWPAMEKAFKITELQEKNKIESEKEDTGK